MANTRGRGGGGGGGSRGSFRGRGRGRGGGSSGNWRGGSKTAPTVIATEAEGSRDADRLEDGKVRDASRRAPGARRLTRLDLV